MKLLNNIIFQYTVITLIVVLVVSVFLGTIISREITNHLIQTHVGIFPHVIQSMIKDHVTTYTFLKSPPGTALPEDVNSFFGDLLSFGTIFRIKVWGKDGTILWSDRPELIGLNYKENIHFSQAIRGNLSYSLSKPGKQENLTEKGHGVVLEMYTPIEKDGEYVGVLELYESDDQLYRQISKNNRIVWISVSSSGIILYALLFVIFYNSYGKQKKIAEQLIQTQDVTIFALAYQAELRDLETGYHLERTSHYVRVLAQELRKHPMYKSYLTDSYISDLVKSAPLHDIGKVGIPDAILHKTGKLDDREFDIIKRHCQYGVMILQRAEKRLTFQSFLKIALQITMHHHEKWNGQGYPRGLSGEDIPLSARIMALPDVYDALRSRRPYKEALTHEKAIEIIREMKGNHFDPLVVEAFLAKEKDFRAISEEMADMA